MAVLLLVGGTACGAGASQPKSAAPISAPVSPSPAASPAQQLEDAAQEIDKALAAAPSGDLATAQKEYKEFDEAWDKIEDGLKAKSRDAYTVIEAAMAEVQTALIKSPTPKKDAAVAALQKLRQVINEQMPKLR